MVRNLSAVDQLEVRTPCNADWESMVGNDQVRFCEHCAKSVHNVSSMTMAQAEKLARDSNGRLCVRYRKLPNGEIRTADTPKPLYQLARKVSKLAASAFAVALTVSNGAIAKSAQSKQVSSSVRGKKKGDTVDEVKNQEKKMFAGSVIGTDMQPLAAAVITMKGTTTGHEYSTISATFGVFCIDDLPVEPYDVSVSAPNFKTLTIRKIDISANPVTKLELIMHEGDPSQKLIMDKPEVLMVMGGAMGFGFSFKVPGVDYDALKQFENGEIAAGRLNERTMMLALQNAVGANRVDSVEALLSAGVKLNGLSHVESNEDQEEIYIAPALFSIKAETSAEIVDKLVNAGADVNVKDKAGRSPIINVAQSGNVAVLGELIKHGAKVTNEDNYGETALSYSVTTDNLETVKTLIYAGADVNHKDKYGYSALVRILSATGLQSANSRDIIRLLKSNGAVE